MQNHPNIGVCIVRTTFSTEEKINATNMQVAKINLTDN